MIKLNAIGNTGQAGLSRAFRQCVVALSSVTDVHVGTLQTSFVGGHPNTFFQGLPQQTETLEKLVGSGRLASGHNVALWLCEGNKLNEHFHKWEGRFNELWAPSEYCKRVLETELKREVKLVPLCVERLKFSPEPHPTFKVLMLFDGASKFLRKNPVQAIRCFEKAFGDRQDVELTVKFKGVAASLLEWMRTEAKQAKVKFLATDLSEDQLEMLYLQSDCVLAPAHSEGFGYHILEAFAYGKLVVGTNYGAPADFMNDDNAFVVPAKETEATDDVYEGSVWGQFEDDDMVDLLREASTDSPERRKLAFETALWYSQAQTTDAVFRALT